MAETDSPWKEALDHLYPLAMRFFLQQAAQRVDWTQDYEALETELRPYLPTSQTGVQRVDKLVKVWCQQTSTGEVLEAGSSEEEFYHFEVQYQPEADFEKRMSNYNDVARVHLRNHVISTAILGDEDPNWRPHLYHWEKEGCSLTFRFRPIKLLDWRGREQELLQDANPFALFVLAHLLILPTKQDQESRAEWKLRLWQRACQHKMEEHDLSTLLRLIDWMLLLPPQRNRALLEQFSAWRKENPMPFVSVFEQEVLEQKQLVLEQKQLVQAKEQQLREGYLQGIALGLKLKFQTAGEALFAQVLKQTDLELLRRFLASLESAASVEELRQLLP